MAERNLPLKHRLLLGAKSQMASVSNKALAETKDVSEACMQEDSEVRCFPHPPFFFLN